MDPSDYKMVPLLDLINEVNKGKESKCVIF